MVKNVREFLAEDDVASVEHEIRGMGPLIEAVMPDVEPLPQAGTSAVPSEGQGQIRVAAEHLLGYAGGNGLLVTGEHQEQFHLDHMAGVFIRNALFAVGVQQTDLQQGDPRLIDAAAWLARNQQEALGVYRSYERRHPGQALPGFHACFRRAQMRLDEAVKHLDSAYPEDDPGAES